MELKDYQNKILADLSRYFEVLQASKNVSDAYHQFWVTNNPPVIPSSLEVIKPYQDTVPGAPHLCVKVPTGGGKTIIAAAALKRIFDAYNEGAKKMVVWLVPSNSILEQTLQNLRDPKHPYRQRINTDFGNRVVVIDKQEALTGQNFSLDSVQNNLTILVISYDSLRTSKKENRKVNQDNGYLQSFESMDGLTKQDPNELNLSDVIRSLRPVVIVDESHNTESKLSKEMINNLAPSFVLDLTATPSESSNIISFTDALELRKNNMVKLPVIVYNQSTKEAVFDKALHLQRELERLASQSKTNYIRPIVLFQAESKKGKEERETFEKVKQSLLNVGIPEEQIKIKTADINELKDVDLMSKDCPVRYIITVNALKEGWDCPFAYILASLADRSSQIDVTQIVGRVLRLPYVHKNDAPALNLSYVLTASSKFKETLDGIVKGLNNAGFSDKDYRAAEDITASNEDTQLPVQTELFGIPSTPTTQSTSEEINPANITFRATSLPQSPLTGSAPNNSFPAAAQAPSPVDDILKKAEEESAAMDALQNNQPVSLIPTDLSSQVKIAKFESRFEEEAKAIRLPEFYEKAENSGENLFGLEEEEKLEGTHLLTGFKLKDQPCNVSLTINESSIYKVDLDASKDGHSPTIFRLDNEGERSYLFQYLSSAKDKESKSKRIAEAVSHAMGNMDPLKEQDIQDYVKRILDGLSEEQLSSFLLHLHEFTDQIKKYIHKLEDEYKFVSFMKNIDTNKIFTRETYAFPATRAYGEAGRSLPKSLYTKEEKVNNFESEVIEAVANLDNIKFWTRNPSRTGFCINGFINHYPDFIIVTQKGTVIILETKGDQLDAKDKIKLGSEWSRLAGSQKYKYFLVYGNRDDVDGAYTKDKFLELIKHL